MKNEAIKVSVIVLTYNHEKYIAQALDSILMQEANFFYEILIGDDYSSDGTREILQEYQRRFPRQIHLFLREENLGAARNAYELLMEAQGDYLAFCEGDDFWLAKNKLQLQVDFLSREPSMIGCSHRCQIVDGTGAPKKNQHLAWVKEKECFTLDDFQGIYLPGQTATIVKRNIFKDSKEDYSFLYHINRNISDRTATLFYLTQGSFGFLPRVMSAYRQVLGMGQTNQIYARRAGRLIHELEYTERLEKLAATLTDQTGIFDNYYKRLYASAVYEFLKKPSRNTWMQIARAARHTGRRVVQPLTFAAGAIQRLYSC